MWLCSYPTAAGLAREKKRKAPSPLGEEAEDAILLELATEPIGSGARYRGLDTPVSRQLCGHSAAPWPILQIGRHLT